MTAEVGVLALQGDYALHRAMIESLGLAARLVRTADEARRSTHLVLPGGESTTMLHLLGLEPGLEDAIREHHGKGRPILATCAGLILLAREVNAPRQRSLGLLDVAVDRNAYGRQIASFVEPVPCPALGGEPLEAVFIRAPVIRGTGPAVEVLARRETPVLVREGSVVAATFHPELTRDARVHRWFVSLG